MKKFITFDVLTAPLEGKSLVEASAGTGKTFSIAVMVLRLILEKNINIKEILLVTFTNNAVAELDERIRGFLRNAFEYAKNSTQQSEVIQQIVDRSINEVGNDEVVKRLHDSILFLDETSVMTIHRFCHQTLSNLAFETGQLFESELVTNFDNVITDQVREFWRNDVVTLPVETLSVLSALRFNQNSIKTVVSEYATGKRYHAFSENRKYDTMPEAQRLLSVVKTSDGNKTQARTDCAALLAQHKASLSAALEANRFARAFIPHLDNVDAFIEAVTAKRDKNYVTQCIPGEILKIIDQISDEEKQVNNVAKSFIDVLYCAALEKVTAGVNAYCSSKGIQSFDGLIKTLHAALNGANRNKIISSLRQQYRAVFIDEFQDTDKLQYDIFLSAFGSGVILFFIGDPKQSIYAFRQADINTYFKAYTDADHLYSMNINFRSSVPMINAMNEFFVPEPGFDFFYFKNAPESIQYFHVASPVENARGHITRNGETEKGITIRMLENNGAVIAGAGQLIFELLTNKQYTIETTDGPKRIVPSDIGILVKNKKIGHEIRQLLDRYNIPSVFVADEKIMDSGEARELYRVVKAIFDPAIENINAALVNNFTGFRSADAVSFDVEKVIEFFKTYKQTWETQSIYSALSAFISDFGIEDHLRKPETAGGLRIITNLHQLMELLHKTAYHQRLNQAELLNWYKRALEIELLEKDESTLRLESDANAVTIMTIHKSKGLQFNIVIAPQMDFRVPAKDMMISLYENSEYITIPLKEMNEQQAGNFAEQSEQEFRRLMYVAVTRAVYKAYVFHNTHFSGTILNTIIPLLENNPQIEIVNDKIAIDTIDYSKKYRAQKNTEPVPAVPDNAFQLKDPFWRYMSYSRLAAKGAPVSIQPDNDWNNGSREAYDDFVFNKLRKGNITGNMVHYLFEKIDFRNTATHGNMIAEAVNRFAASNAETYNQFLPRFIDHVLNSKITTGDDSFCLSEVGNTYKIAELEFDFTTSLCGAAQFTGLIRNAGLSIQLQNNQPLHGLMKGFIDLLFLLNDKFYILDWKTNFLGNRPEDYSPQSLEAVMQQLNYQLQFIIYTLAVKKYLAARLGRFNYENFGGIIYCFVRGMRKDATSGIYFYKPTAETIRATEKLLTPFRQKAL